MAEVSEGLLVDIWAVALFWFLIAVVLAQAALGLRFLLVIKRFRRRLLSDAECPRAAIVLCLRGTDPFLSKCLTAVLDQDYPDFELRVVVDHPSDPSQPLVTDMLEKRRGARIVVQNLEFPSNDCSLKCSSLIQAVTTADETIQFFAQLDADVIPHRTWLRELATALSDEKTAAATGNRWYMPHELTFGSLVRYAWNAAAVVQMETYGIAWGGSLAIKSEAIRKAGLVDRWGKAFCEDTMLFRVLRENGWRTAFVPSLMMINRETCDVASFQRWVQRQLLTARLYHPGWPAVLLHGWGTTLVLAAAVVSLLIAVVLQSSLAASWLLAGIVFYEASMFVLLLPIELAIRQIVKARNEPVGWLSFSGLCKLFLAVPVTQIVYPLTLLAAARMQNVDWRGIHYEVAGPWNIRMLHYQPYVPTEQEELSTASL